MLFIEFEPQFKKLWTFCQTLALLTMPAHQVWSYDVTQDANFQNVLFCPNSTLNIRKSHKISSGKALYFRSYQQKPQSAGSTPLPPSARNSGPQHV